MITFRHIKFANMNQSSPLFHTEPSYDNCSITDEGAVPASIMITEETRDADDGDLSDWEYFTSKYDDDPDECIPMANEANSNDSTIPTTTMTTTALVQLLPYSATQVTQIMAKNHAATTSDTVQWNAQMEPATGRVAVHATATASAADTVWYSSQHQTVPMLLTSTCHSMVPYSYITAVPQPVLLAPLPQNNDDRSTTNGDSISPNEGSLWNIVSPTEPTMHNGWYFPRQPQIALMPNTVSTQIVLYSTSTAAPQQPMPPMPLPAPAAAGWYTPQHPQMTPMPLADLAQIVPPYKTNAASLPQPMPRMAPPPHTEQSTTTRAVNNDSSGWASVYSPIGGGNGGSLCSDTNVPPSLHRRHLETVSLAAPREMMRVVDNTTNAPHHLTKEDWTALNDTAASSLGPLDNCDVVKNATTDTNMINHADQEETKVSDVSYSRSSLKSCSDKVECTHYNKLSRNVSVFLTSGATSVASSSSGTVPSGAPPPPTTTTTKGGSDNNNIPPVLSSSSPPAMCRPMMVYNYYFRDERDNILRGIKKRGDPLPPPVRDFSPSKLEHLLYQRWYVDPCKKRRSHRKSHGKIDFSSLSSEIANRWRQLPEHGRDFYRQVAKADKDRYDHLLSTPQHVDNNKNE